LIFFDATKVDSLTDFLDACCPVCKLQNAKLFERVEDWQYAQCSACDFVFTYPHPEQSYLNTLYTQQSESSGGKIGQSSSRKRRAFLRALSLRKYLQGGKKALDIGCGAGFIVESMRQVGAVAYGFDINEASINFAKTNYPKSHFYLNSYDTISEFSDFFDFIYSSEVIEHVSELDAYLELIVKVSRPKAYVYVTTPDFSSDKRPANVLEWGEFAPPEHIQFFSERNLIILFDRYGFKFVKRFKDKKTGLKALFQRTA